MNYSHLGILVFTLFCFCSQIEAVKKLECYVNATGDKFDPNNIYKCDTNTTCCYEQGQPSCCSVKPIGTASLEQAQLWGTLAVLIAILAFVMFCCRHDGDWCCNRKDGGRYKYFCCGPLIYREGKEPPPKEIVIGDVDDDDDSEDDEKIRAMNQRAMNNQNVVQRPADAPPPYSEMAPQHGMPAPQHGMPAQTRPLPSIPTA